MKRTVCLAMALVILLCSFMTASFAETEKWEMKTNSKKGETYRINKLDVTLKKAYLRKIDGIYNVLLEIDFKNNSKKDVYFEEAVSVFAFQGEEWLEENYDDETAINKLAKAAPGKTETYLIRFMLCDTKESIKIHLDAAFDTNDAFDDRVFSLSLKNADIKDDEVYSEDRAISEALEIIQSDTEEKEDSTIYDPTGKTLREIFDSLDLAKAIRSEVGLVSIDQPIPEGKLDNFRMITYAIYEDAKTAVIDSLEGIQYLSGLTYANFARGMYPKYKNITSLPDGFYSLEHVIQLCLGATSITEIDKRIGNMVSIQNLYLDYMNIESLPEEMGNLRNLKILDLEGSTISSLPASFVNLKSLQKLNLSGTKIKEFPLEILSMENLYELNLSDTEIEYLPKEISNMKSLRVLDISRTKITSLPVEMYDMNLSTFKQDGLSFE